MLNIVFDLTQFEEVELIPVADVHIGNINADIQSLHDTISYIMQEPEDPKCARICLLNGDLTESVTKSSVGDLFNMTMAPQLQVATMIEMLKPLSVPSEKYPQGKILSYCGGNHDEGRYKDTGITASESIAVGLNMEERYSPDGCYSFIKLRTKQSSDISTVTVYNSHMSGSSGTAGGKVNRALKLGLNGGIVADLCIGSHVHQPVTFKEDYLSPNTARNVVIQKTITYVITNAFLRYSGYAQKLGMKPSTIKVPKIFIKQIRIGNKANRRIDIEVLL